MSAYTTWLANSSTFTVDVQAQIGFKAALSTAAIGTTILDAVDAIELGHGWDAPTVAKNRAIRSGTKRAFVSKNGIAVGAVIPELLGDRKSLLAVEATSLTYLGERARQIGAPGTPRKRDGSYNTYGYDYQTKMGVRPDAPCLLAADNSNALSFATFAAELVLGFAPANPVVESVAAIAGFAPNRGELDPAVAAISSSRAALVCMMYKPNEPMGSDIDFVEYAVTLSFDRPSWFPFYIAVLVPAQTVSPVSTYAHATPASAVAGWRIGTLVGPTGCGSLVTLAKPLDGGSLYALSSGEWATPTTSMSSDSQIRTYDLDLAEVHDGPVVPGATPGGHPASGLSTLLAYSIGGPQFAIGWAALGATSYDPFSRALNVESAGIHINWDAALLSTIEDGVTTEVDASDRSALTGLRVRSFVHPERVSAADVSIADLTLAEELSPIEISDLVFIPEDTVRGTPATTFGEAELRAKKLDLTVAHAVWHDVTDEPFEFIVEAKVVSNPSPLAPYTATVGVVPANTKDVVATETIVMTLGADYSIVSFTKNGTWTEAMERAVIDNAFGHVYPTPMLGTYTQVGDNMQAVRAAAEALLQAPLTTAERAALVGKSAEYMDDFIERKLFGNATTDVRSLTRARRAAYSMLCAARSRTQLSSIVVSSLVYARAAAKQLTA